MTDERPDAVLAQLRDGVEGVLNGRLVGVYLYGSLALGGFDPASSDVDVLVVTTEELPGPVVAALRDLHARIRARALPFSDELECSYIPRMAIRRYDPEDAVHPSIGNDWPFGLEFHDRSWIINSHVVREHGVVLSGPPPTGLIDAVPDDELRAAAAAVVEDFWIRQHREPNWLRPRKYQAFAMLTACRALYTLELGRAVTKPVAAAWALQSLAGEWRELVTRSLAWRQRRDDTPGDPAETVRFLRYALERSRSRR